jgi:multicomponent K+:H+ antiporter subunit A
MSAIALVGGVCLYLQRYFHGQQATGNAPLRLPFSGRRLFDMLIVAMHRTAERMVRFASSRRLQPQLFLIVCMALAVGALPLLARGLARGAAPPTPVDPVYLLPWLMGCACAVGAAVQAKFHRLAALIMLGGAGLFTALSFAWFSAPDLALTQLSVEVVTLVLFLLGLRWLPKRRELDDPRTVLHTRWRRRRDMLLAVLIGVGLSALSYALLTRQAPQSISPFFIEKALPEGGGTNVVNVMLVDFRAFDTLGEITVLGIVGLTVYALLRRFRPARETVDPTEQQQVHVDAAGADLIDRDGDGDDHLPPYLEVPAVLVRLLLPVAGLLAFHLFMRGHNEPGGGFVAGLVVAIAFIAQYMVSGTRWVEARMHLLPTRWIATGLLVALVTGLGSLALEHPFLTTHTAHVTWPLVGEVHLPTAALFDLGVFAVVVGSTLLLLTAIAHQSLRARRRQGVAVDDRKDTGWKP